MVVAALAGPVTIVGLYFMAEDSLLQAMRLSSAVAASAQVFERDLSNLSLASGDPDEVIASLDPKVSRDDFVTDVRWGAPGQAFQLSIAAWGVLSTCCGVSGSSGRSDENLYRPING